MKTTVVLLFCCCSAQAQLDSTRSALLKLMQQLNRKAEHGRNGVKKGDAESGDRNTWNSCNKKIAACQRSDPMEKFQSRPGGGWCAAVPPSGVCWHGTTPGVCTGGFWKPTNSKRLHNRWTERLKNRASNFDTEQTWQVPFYKCLHGLTSVRCIESMWFPALWHVSGQRRVCKHYHWKGVRSSVCGFRPFVAWNVSVEDVIFMQLFLLLQRYSFSYIRYFRNEIVVMFRWQHPPKIV